MATLAEVLRQAGYVTPQGQVVGPRTDLAQKLKSYVMNIPQNAAQNLANQRADIDAALTMGQGGIQIGDRAAFERQMAEVPNLMGAIAYHGTPHTIKGKFDISKVGTGEGAQAYGHGMYFAENPAVAKGYQQMLGKSELSVGGKDLEGAQKFVADRLRNSTYEDTLGWINANKKVFGKEKTAEYKNALESLKETPIESRTGNLYKVDIPDEYIPNMLDWGKPLAEQTPEVQAAIQKLGDRFRPLDDMEAKNVTGERLYRRIENSFGKYYGNQANPDASALLNSVGIKGIRYADEGSRNAQQRWIARHPKGGESDFPTLEQAQAFINRYPNDKYTLIEPKPLTSNFVVFDPSDVKILEQNSKPMTRKEIIEQELEKVAK